MFLCGNASWENPRILVSVSAFTEYLSDVWGIGINKANIWQLLWDAQINWTFTEDNPGKISLNLIQEANFRVHQEVHLVDMWV